MSDENTTDINIEDILAEVGNMSMEELQAAVVEKKARQRVATKKYYNPEAAKLQRQRAAAKVKVMEQKLLESGMTEQQIAELVGERADVILAEAAE